jgi:transposase-like protein
MGQEVKSIKKFSSILELVRQLPDEKTCKMYLASLRWPTTKDLYCPHCGSTDKIYIFKDKVTYKCSSCLLKFNARTGTIYTDSKVPLQKWFIAIYLITSHKKGISARQLAKDIDVHNRTAWFMNHRIRHAAAPKQYAQLTKVVEVDETYVGGKNINKHFHKKIEGVQGRNTTDKTAVFGMMQRDGEVRAFKVPSVHAGVLRPILEKHVSHKSTIMTDEWTSYASLSKVFKKHMIVKHGEGQYVNGICHTNNIENFWSQFKRGIYGIYHQISRKHMDRYVSEYVFRYNSRKMSEYDRFNLLLKESVGKLTFKELIGK